MKKALSMMIAALLAFALCAVCYAAERTRIGISNRSIMIPEEYHMREVYDDWDGLLKCGEYNNIVIRFMMYEEDEYRDIADMYYNDSYRDGRLITVNGFTCLEQEGEMTMYESGMVIIYSFIEEGHLYYVDFQDISGARSIQQVRAIAEPIWNTLR